MRGYVVVTVLVLWVARGALAEVAPQPVELKSGDLSVVVKTHDGKPLGKAALKLTGGDDKVLATATTGEDGKCTLKDTKPGSYRLLVADRAAVAFAASEKGKLSELLVVLPPPAPYAAGQPKPGAKIPLLSTFLVGGAAVAGGVAAVGSGGGGGSNGHP